MAAKNRSVPVTKPVRRKKKSARAAGNTRREIRDLTLKLIQERNLELDDLSQLSEEVFHRATESVRKALPASRKSALRQLVDGVADAWAAAAKSSAAAVRHAKKNGVRAANRDLSRLAKNLRSLEREFFRTLERYSGRIEGDIGQEFKSLTARVRKTGTAIRPAIQAAGKAVVEHPLETVGDLVSTGVKVGADALSGAVLGVSGVLEGLGKSMRRGKQTKKRAKRKTRSALKK